MPSCPAVDLPCMFNPKFKCTKEQLEIVRRENGEEDE